MKIETADVVIVGAGRSDYRSLLHSPAPATAEADGDQVLGRPPSIDLTPIRLDREGLP